MLHLLAPTQGGSVPLSPLHLPGRLSRAEHPLRGWAMVGEKVAAEAEFAAMLIETSA